MSQEVIYWSLNLGPILYLPFSLASTWLLRQEGGLRSTIRVSASFSFAAALLRILAVVLGEDFRGTVGCNILLLAAGACVGIAGPFTQGSPSQFSAEYFPESERTRATGIAFLGTYLGASASYILSPAMVQDPLGKDLPSLLWLELALCLPPFLLSFLAFPAEPEGAGGDEVAALVPQGRQGGGEGGGGLGEPSPTVHCSATVGLRAVAGNGSFLLLAAACGLLNGIYSTWCASLAMLLRPVGVSTSKADLMAFVSTLLYCVGNFAGGEIGDRLFKGRFKLLLALLIAAAVLTMAWFDLTIPELGAQEPIIASSFGGQLVAIALAGLFMGCTAPLFLELGAEVSHPIPEGTR